MRNRVYGSLRLCSLVAGVGAVILLCGSTLYSFDVDKSKATLPSEVIQAIRNNDCRSLETRLQSKPALLEARDEFGSTPLILAAMYSGEECVRMLLDRGADPNAKNNSDVTPLMNAVWNETNVRLVLERGADVNAESVIGNTPLMLAAVYPYSTPIVRRLLDHGADVNHLNRYGIGALIAASISGNPETMRLLLDKGAKVDVKPVMNPSDKHGKPLHPLFSGGQTALMWTSLLGHLDAMRLLLERGADCNEFSLLGNPLIMAAYHGETEAARVLLDHGAEVDLKDKFMAGLTPLMWALTSDETDESLVRLLVERGADVNAQGGELKGSFMEAPHTPLVWAYRRGDPTIIETLTKHGAKKSVDSWAKRNPTPPRRDLPEGNVPVQTVVNAILQAIPKIETSALESYQDYRLKNFNCASCHNQYLPLITLTEVKKKGLPRNESVAQELAKFYTKPFTQFGDEISEPLFHPAPPVEFGFALMSISGEGVPADGFTDRYVHFLAANQAADGRWYNYLPRPPIDSTDVSATAWAIQGLKLYPLPARRAEFEERIARGVEWLKNVKPRLTDERVFQLLGLKWGGEPVETLEPLAKALIAEQRPDGGWAQMPALSSDAYATGEVLYALHHAAGINADHPAYQQGIVYLLRTQLEDGTWFVRRRAFPFQPTMFSGFPHGRDSWVSTAATSWAVAALLAAVEPAPSDTIVQNIQTSTTGSTNIQLPEPVHRPVDFLKDVKPILVESCAGCHGSVNPRSRYSVESYESLIGLGEQGKANIVPGDSENSPLIRYVAGAVEDMEMPPEAVRHAIPALNPEQIGILRAWIDQGALTIAGR